MSQRANDRIALAGIALVIVAFFAIGCLLLGTSMLYAAIGGAAVAAGAGLR